MFAIASQGGGRKRPPDVRRTVAGRLGDRLWLYLAAGSALAAGILVWLFLRNVERTYQDEAEMAPVLIAGRYIPLGTSLRPALFQTRQIPKAFVEPGAVRDFAVLESSPGHPRFRGALPIPEGAQLVQREMVALRQAEALSQTIPQNLVAVSFGVDRLRGVGGNIEPGDLIDLLHTAKGRGEMDAAPRQTGLLFEAVRVIAVGKKWMPLSPAKPEAKDALLGPPTEEDETTVLTVLLNPAAALRLAHLRENGILSAVLRAPDDEQVSQQPLIASSLP